MNQVVNGIKLSNIDLCNGCLFLNLEDDKCDLGYFDNDTTARLNAIIEIQRPQKCKKLNQWEVK